MASATETVIAELLDARRDAQNKVREIDEALMALQRVAGVAKDRRGRKPGTVVSAATRQLMSDRMKARGASAKASSAAESNGSNASYVS
jgi:hypothetical protein